MTKRLGLIHTASFLAPVFSKLCSEIMPGVQFFNIVDESLIQDTIKANALTTVTFRRLAGYIQSAEETGADVILVTCSSVGPAVEAARPFVDIPVLRVDEPMADKAIALAERVGVIATLPTTLEPTQELVQARAEVHGCKIAVVPYLCEGAFEAISNGDTDMHDQKVREGLRQLMNQAEVIVLAQASMARVVDTLDEEDKMIPILSSPRLGVEAAKKMIDSLGEQ